VKRSRNLCPSGWRGSQRFGTTLRLPDIPADAWLSGLRARYAADDVTCASGALERLLEMSGGYPRSTLLIAQHAHLVLLADEAHVLTLTAVDEGFYSALAADAIGHDTEMERVRWLGPAAVEAVRRVAARTRPYAGASKARPVERALLALLGAVLIEKRARGEYALTDLLFAHYLRRA
jgi:hypothetical protein